MFGLSFTEVLMILAIALVVLGPDRLPGIAKALGRATREFRKATREIRATLEVEEVRRTLRERVAEEHEPSKAIRPSATVTQPVSDDLAAKKEILRQESTDAPAAPTPATVSTVEAAPGPGAPQPVPPSTTERAEAAAPKPDDTGRGEG